MTVPKILPYDVPMPTSGSADDNIPSLQRIAEQNVAILVPGGGGGRLAALQGFLPGQSSPAPQFSEERISERIVEQIVDIPGGGLQGFRPVQGFFFALFPPNKVRRSPGTRVQEKPETSAHPR